MIYYTSWLDTDQSRRIVQSQRNDADAARYYEALRPLRHVVGYVTAGIRQIWQLWLARHRRRKIVSELSGLDDRMLKDIGVSRAQIQALARGSAPIIDTPSVTPPQRETMTSQTVAQPACQVIPLPTADHRRREIGLVDHNQEQRRHLPSSAA